MKLINKILIPTTLVAPAVIAPVGFMTSCSQSWGTKTPIAFGSSSNSQDNDPFKNLRNGGYKDLNGQDIGSYIQSNYVIDNAKSYSYAFCKPEKWDKDNNKWVDTNIGWYNSATNSFETTATDKDKKAQTSYRNISLSANITFTPAIATMINKTISYALAYQLSQMPSKSADYNTDSFKTSWGGSMPFAIAKDGSNVNGMEWLYSSANSYNEAKADALMRGVSTNFNYIDMPIPAYNDDKTIHAKTKAMVAGTTELEQAEETAYWSTKTETKSGAEVDYVTYTYPSVPVLVRTNNYVQRYVNPQINNSYQISDYYYYKDGKETKLINKEMVQKRIGNAWNSMADYLPAASKANTKPEHLGFKLSVQDDTDKQSVSPKVTESKIDGRLSSKQIKGTDFIAFVTYSYVVYKKDQTKKPTMSISALQTVMPAYLLSFKDDIYKKANSKSDKWIVDTTKADKYTTQLLELLARTSSQGRVAHAKDLNDESKQLLKFLNFMFAKKDTADSLKLEPISF